MCYRCILSAPNLSFILVTKTPMNGNNSQPTKLSSASLRLRFSLTRKVKESPPHEMVLGMQALFFGVFGQFVALFEWLNTVVATFSILLFNSISRSQRLSLQVEQMDVESWTTSSCWSNILMLGGLVTSCPVTCVFFRLILSLKYFQGELKRFMSCCSLFAECVVTAASSAQRKLRKCFSRILVLAFNLARLKNLP